MLRFVVAVLALLATAKVGSHWYLYREATSSIIVSTYRDKAISACAAHGAESALKVPPKAWSRPSKVALEIGKSSLDVAIWQVHHRLWEARFKNPFLFVTANAETAHIYCEYDIVRGLASVHRL
ncbi:MAG: hypothetical protein AAFO62_01645 [Pseudomonadota bacterium]